MLFINYGVCIGKKNKELPTQENTIESFFERIEDHRLHKLIDVIIIAICEVVAGADTYEQIENFGKKREKWL